MVQCLTPHREPMQTTTPKTVRLTIPVSPEVHQVFQRIAEASSIGTGRAMGNWLQDTIEAAEFMADKLVQARAAPRIVAQEMHAYALGLADETGEVLRRLREGNTPPSNTGVNSKRTEGPNAPKNKR